MKICNRILELVENDCMNHTKLGAILVSEYPRLNGNEVLQAIDDLVNSGHLIEIEYFLPNSMKNKLYFPKGTRIHLSVN